MWIWVAAIAGYVWLRRRQGLPLLPAFLGADAVSLSASKAFKNGAILIPTKEGVMAVPADTPVIHPALAASSGLLSSSATATLAQALAASTKVDLSIESSLTSGAWAMMDPDAGAGPDYYVDELGIPRSNSLGSRPWGTR